MSDREDFLNDMSPDNGPTDAPEPQDAPEHVDAPETGTPAAESTEAAAAPSAALTFLDSISNPDPNAPAAAPAPAPAAAAAPTEQPGAPAASPAPGAAPAETPATPPAAKTPEQEEAELLEGVKSERGKERIREKLAELRQKDSDLQAATSDLGEFRTMVLDAYQDPNDFARALEFGRLITAGDERSLTTALAMLDEQRNALALRLGVDVAGVDQLADFPELKAAVENMEITREYAVKLAKGQRQERVQTEQRQAAQLQQQEADTSRRNFEAEITTLTDKATQYFTTRAQEVDYPAKMEAIKAHFAKPENVQAFVQDFQPSQWLAQFKFMYDNIRTAPPPRPSAQHQPLRARPAIGGTPASNPNASSVDRMASTLDSMGI